MNNIVEQVQSEFARMKMQVIQLVANEVMDVLNSDYNEDMKKESMATIKGICYTLDVMQEHKLSKALAKDAGTIIHNIEPKNTELLVRRLNTPHRYLVINKD